MIIFVQTFAIEALSWPDDGSALRRQVRSIVAEHVHPENPAMLTNSWTTADPAFSRVLGAAGLLGMTWPKEYGGHDRTPLERYIVLEELLAAGARGKARANGPQQNFCGPAVAP